MPDNLTDADRIAHLIDDAETIRTHPIRTLGNIRPLLSDAVHALDNGNLDVVREFLERSRDAVDRELKWLATAGN